MGGKIGSANVIEVSNRGDINNTTDGTAAVSNNLANHQSGSNTNAHGISNINGLQVALDGKENSFSKNSAFNKDFGSSAETVCEGNDVRLSDARVPLAHTHGISDVSGLVLALDGKADKSSFSGSLVVVTSVDFVTSTVTTAEINVVDGIITQII